MSDQSTDTFTEFNDFDKIFDKELHTYNDYVLQAQQYLYFRNLLNVWTVEELEIFLYKNANFTWNPLTEGDLFIANGCIFNILYNTMNTYFNPDVVFRREYLDNILMNGFGDFHVVNIIDGTTYNYDFVIQMSDL